MIPATYNLALYRGDSCHWQFNLWADSAQTQPVDLTGVVVDSMIRDRALGGSYMLALACTVTVPNTIDMTLDPIDSSAMTITKGVWDLQLTYPSGDIVTILAGTVSVTQDVTYTNEGKKKLAVVV